MLSITTATFTGLPPYFSPKRSSLLKAEEFRSDTAL